MKTQILIDGKNLVYRSMHAHASLSHQGVSTGMYFGILQSLLNAKANFADSKFTWFWDATHPTKLWRRSIDPTYKAHREEGGSLEEKAVNNVRGLVASLGIPWLQFEGAEADDLMSLFCYQYRQEGRSVVFLSTDRDFYQLLTEINPRVLCMGRNLVSKAILEEKYGISPNKWLRYRALTGDVSDKIPGLPGCGPVAAPILLDMGAHPKYDWDWQPQPLRVKYAKKFKDGWPSAMLSYRLSKLHSTAERVPLTGLDNFISKNMSAQLAACEADYVRYCSQFGLKVPANKFELLRN